MITTTTKRERKKICRFFQLKLFILNFGSHKNTISLLLHEILVKHISIYFVMFFGFIFLNLIYSKNCFSFFNNNNYNKHQSDATL